MFYQKVKENWRNLSRDLKQSRLIEWRRGNTVVRVLKPSRLERARSLGYRAKQGLFVVRVRVLRGGRQRARPLKHGRKSKRATSKKIVKKNYLWICEERANRKFKNCEVLGSYPLLKDGKNYWAEVILIDRDHPQIKKDLKLKNVAKKKGRTYRGLTSQGRRSRGLLKRGKGREKMRPSLRAHSRKGK
ncbi:MAG: 50S ribosomal protein L15e [Nanoarchaeota archaeon]|nr:50S ribosomal protein L15e [Nanoarchaeota archaeon]|tara:strand:- start:14258 stop:14821 length:564 start_codon:yes stop_codon:yes gene_type:complete